VGPYDLVSQASIAHQGMDHFAPASYIQTHTVGGSGAAVEVKQFSNGGLANLDLAAAYLSVRDRPAAALLTTSDKFVPPAYDRYNCDRGIVFGDGATGLVLSRTPGVARLLATVVISDGTYGAVYIGDASWDDAPTGGPVDLRTRREQFLANNAGLLMEVVQSTTARQRESVERALADAGLGAPDIRRWVFLNVGQTQVDNEFRRSLAIDEEKTTWQWGREVGHIGAGDQVAGLAHLLETGAVQAGDKVALCSMGMGFSYGCAIVEVLQEPEWTSTTS
jgi:3-oxoacyl-[acyl-carrier-protein] synthase-3